MSTKFPADISPEHAELSALIPWYLNATLGDEDRQRLDAHLQTCEVCRDDLILERRVYAGVNSETAIEYMPAASLQRLRARLDGVQPAVSLLAADRWMQYRAQQSAPNYYTVTSASPHTRDEAIRAVFAPTITLVDLQSILDESQLRIVSGPTEAGVYSLAAKTSRPIDESLAQLRQHSTVRFAESTRPDGGPGAPR
jgi:hypothetical protein